MTLHQIRPEGQQDQAADSQLARMGYEAELPRHLSFMSIFGLYVLVSPTGEDPTNWRIQILRHHCRALRREHYVCLSSHQRNLRHYHLGLGTHDPDLPLHRGFAGGDMRMLSNVGGYLLLVCHSVQGEVRRHYLMGNRLAALDRKLDVYVRHNVWGCSVDWFRCHALPSRSYSSGMGNRPYLLGHHCRLLFGQPLRGQTSESDQHDVCVLDRGNRPYHHDRSPCHGETEKAGRVCVWEF
jgi:hypothetical protein